MSRIMFDINIMCDAIIDAIKQIDYDMSYADMLTLIRLTIDKYGETFDGKSIDDKKLLMKECRCCATRLKSVIQCAYCEHMCERRDDMKAHCHSVHRGLRVAIHCTSIDTYMRAHQQLNRLLEICYERGEQSMVANNDETIDELEMENEEPVKKVIKKKRFINKTGFPRLKKKVSRKLLANTKQCSYPITNKCSDNKINESYSNGKNLLPEICDQQQEQKTIQLMVANDDSSTDVAVMGDEKH